MLSRRVRAVNELGSNLVHDDEFARRLGYRGGLVPGVNVYGYMAELPAQRWGERWLRGGTMSARFLKPVYDAEEVTVTAIDAGAGLDLEVRNPEGELCARGRAEPGSDEPPPDPGLYPVGALPVEPRPPVLVDGETLGTLTTALELRDHAWPARLANRVLTSNFALPPWLHVESRTRHLGLANAGEQVTVRARVAGLWERAGHRFVDLDVLVLRAGSEEALAQLRHVAIYGLAQLRGARGELAGG